MPHAQSRMAIAAAVTYALNQARLRVETHRSPGLGQGAPHSGQGVPCGRLASEYRHRMQDTECGAVE